MFKTPSEAGKKKKKKIECAQLRTKMALPRRKDKKQATQRGEGMYKQLEFTSKTKSATLVSPIATSVERKKKKKKKEKKDGKGTFGTGGVLAKALPHSSHIPDAPSQRASTSKIFASDPAINSIIRSSTGPCKGVSKLSFSSPSKGKDDSVSDDGDGLHRRDSIETAFTSCSEAIEDTFGSSIMDGNLLKSTEAAACKILTDIAHVTKLHPNSPECSISGLVFPPWWPVSKVGRETFIRSPDGRTFTSKSSAFSYMQKFHKADVSTMFDQAVSGETGFRGKFAADCRLHERKLLLAFLNASLAFSQEERNVHPPFKGISTFPSDWQMLKNPTARKSKILIRCPKGNIYKSVQVALNALALLCGTLSPSTRRHKQKSNGATSSGNNEEQACERQNPPPAQDPPVQDPPAQDPPAQNPPAQDPPPQALGKRHKSEPQIEEGRKKKKKKEKKTDDGEEAGSCNDEKKSEVPFKEAQTALYAKFLQSGSVIKTKRWGELKVLNVTRSSWLTVSKVEEKRTFSVRKSDLLKDLKLKPASGMRDNESKSAGANVKKGSENNNKLGKTVARSSRSAQGKDVRPSAGKGVLTYDLTVPHLLTASAPRKPPAVRHPVQTTAREYYPLVRRNNVGNGNDYDGQDEDYDDDQDEDYDDEDEDEDDGNDNGNGNGNGNDNGNYNSSDYTDPKDVFERGQQSSSSNGVKTPSDLALQTHGKPSDLSKSSVCQVDASYDFDSDSDDERMFFIGIELIKSSFTRMKRKIRMTRG